MPTLSRWFIRTAFAALVAGLGLAVVTASKPTGGLLSPTVLHLLVVGWLTQMVFGVAYWLFPTQTGPAPRGREWLSVVCYLALNVGLLLRVAAEPRATASGPRTAALIGSAVLQLVAAFAFVANTWPRVRTRT